MKQKEVEIKVECIGMKKNLFYNFGVENIVIEIKMEIYKYRINSILWKSIS